MFTGIIECLGTIEKITRDNHNIDFTISSAISKELKVDQSISHNGVCLTVIEKNEHSHVVTAIKQTLDLSNLNKLETGMSVNLERCTKEIKIIGLMKRKKILGSFFKPVERDDVEFLKIISRRLKLEKSKVANENQLRIQTEALISANQNNETLNLDDVSNINQNVRPIKDTVSVN